MTKDLIVQLISSFLIGGGLISFLSLLAEKIPQRFSGIILSLPSTIILGYFFLGYGQSPQAVAKIVPASIPALGLAVLYPLIYVNLAGYFQNHQKLRRKGWVVFCCFIITTILWLIAALPLVIFEHTHLPGGIIIYVVLALISHLFFRKLKGEKFSPRKYPFSSILLRAVFVGLLISIVTYLAETMNPFWAGVIAMFPAGLASTLIVMHWSNSAEHLFSAVKNVAIGSLSVFSYALAAMIFFPFVGIYWGTLLSLIPGLMVAAFLAWIQNSRFIQSIE